MPSNFWSAKSFVLCGLLAVASVTGWAQELPSPEAYFGFEMGADRKLARWDKLVAYYELLTARSPKMRLVNMGPTTLGNPFLVLFISSPDNLAKLEALRQFNATLTDPRDKTKEAVDQAIDGGKAVVVQSMGLHSTEVAASQMAAELVFDLLTRTDNEVTRILENTIAIMIPCFNPDGEIMVTDWYNEWVGTDYEGAGLPWLYHHYIGHDNNRDAFMTNTVESQYGAQILFRDWVPQAYIDHHQMGSYGARMYVPPYAEPIRPGGDPLVWREMSWYGAHIAYREEEAAKSGIVNAAIYSGWGHFGFHWITPFHNIAGMLTESASARLASPLFLHPDQLQGSRRGMPEYEAQTTFPNPWPGGWWRVRDIVEQQKVSAVAVLDMAAGNRETVLRNSYLKASRQTKRGAEGETVAYLIPSQQHDPLTAAKMINKLLGQGIDVKRASEEFVHQRRVYGAGSYVVRLAQPKRGVIRWLLGRTFYPDNQYTRDRDNNPIRPYDMSTDNMAEYMGVRVEPVSEPISAPLKTVDAQIKPSGEASRGEFGYLLSGALNDGFKAVNAVLDEGVRVGRVEGGATGEARTGDFVVGADLSSERAARIAAETGVDFHPLDSDLGDSARAVRRLRIGMYQRYYGGNIDEGWTRLLLERFGFPYKSLMDAEIKAGELNHHYDVIILPADSVVMMTGEREGRGGFRGRPEGYPEKYRSGFGQEGVDALQAFVKAGGRLVTFGAAGELPIEKFSLPIRNVVAGLPSKEFWCPGSTLRVRVDRRHPLAYGMPGQALAMFLQGNHAYQVVASSHNERVDRIITFIERDILQSGWLLGEEHIAEKAAMVSVEHGEGQVVLIGFRPQHRVQTHGTFKLVFNALLGR